jgi:hypothetical protein
VSHQNIYDNLTLTLIVGVLTAPPRALCLHIHKLSITWILNLKPNVLG